MSEAFKARNVGRIVEMLFVEIFVMFFEVVFLYRELIDAITPWIAANTGFQMGFGWTLAFASFGWIGIRAMTWFLFGRFGTPAMIAVLARETISVETVPGERPRAPEPDWWRGPISALNQLSDSPSNFRLSILWFIIIAIVMSLVLMRTRYGNWVFATGGNPGAALAQGVAVNRVKVANFVLAGLLAGVAA